MKRIAAGVVALALAGCAGPPPPPDAFYRLEVAAPAAGKVVLPGVLEIDRLATDGVLSERALAFAAAEGGKLGHYKYDYWSEAPGLMMQDRLAGYLRAAAIADRVVTPELRLLADWTVRGKVRRLEQLVGRDAVAVELELAVTSARDGRLVLQETYARTVPARSERVEDAVVAAEAGVTEIFVRFLADLVQARAGGRP